MTHKVQLQAQVLSFLDVFYLLTLLFASLAVFAVLMRKPPEAREAAAGTEPGTELPSSSGTPPLPHPAAFLGSARRYREFPASVTAERKAFLQAAAMGIPAAKHSTNGERICVAVCQRAQGGTRPLIEGRLSSAARASSQNGCVWKMFDRIQESLSAIPRDTSC